MQPMLRIGSNMTKRTIDDLALFGGPPLFAEPLHVGAPNVGDKQRLMRRIEEILERNWLTNDGPCVESFEREVARRVGVKHCIATTNGTLALELAARGLGMHGEVIVPAFTFVATVHAVRWQGMVPVFCDIRADDFNIDPSRIEALITPRTTGILAVHLWGRSCDVQALEAMARKHGLRLLFDASHAFGCTYHGRSIGQFGDAEVFSFHATKFINAFEGGAIVTNDDELAARVRLMKNFGFTGTDEVSYLGINGKMTEVAAAMGLTSLESFDTFVRRNRDNYRAYRTGLASLEGLRLIPFPEDEQCNYQYVTVQVDPERAGLDRDQLIRLLRAEKVLARRYFYPGVHRMEPYRSDPRYRSLRLPVTDLAASRMICLPTGIHVSPKQIEALCRLLGFIIDNAERIKGLMDAGYRYARHMPTFSELTGGLVE